MRDVALPFVVLSILVTVGCARSISPQAKEELAQPVDCETAEQDIATLESERASVAKQISSGVRSVFPAAVVGGILRRDTKDRAKVAVGAYNKEIEAKITEIRQTCGLQP